MINKSEFVFFKNCVITDFNNTIYFDSVDKRDAFFDNNFETYTSTTMYNFIRDESSISVSHNYYDMQLCNYGYFIEGNRSQNRIYFRIISTDYENEGSTTVAFATDFFMTYNVANLLLNNIFNCQIDRRHYTNFETTKFMQTMLTSGDIIPRDKKFAVATKTHFFNDFVIVFTASVELEAKWGTPDKPLVPVSSGGTFDAITSPQNVYQTSEENFTVMMKKLQDYPWIAQNITSVIKVPTSIFDSSDMYPVKLNETSDQILNRFKDGKLSSNFVLDDLKFSKKDILDIFKLTEKDLTNLRSPYFHVEFTNWQGSTIPIYFENLNLSLDINDKDFLSFNCQTLLGYDNKIMVYPIKYLSNGDNASDGVGRGSYLNSAIEFGNFDSVPVLIDNAKLSMARSAYTRDLDQSRLLSSRVSNVLTGSSSNNSIGDRLSDAYSVVQNFASSNVVKMGMNIANGLNDEHRFYQDQEARFADMRTQTPSVSPQTNNNTFQIANELFGITLKFYGINSVDYTAVDQYYKNFGHSYPIMGKVTPPNNFTIMDYIKCTPTQLSDPRLSADMCDIVSLLLQNGVKFWHENGKGKDVFRQDLNLNEVV